MRRKQKVRCCLHKCSKCLFDFFDVVQELFTCVVCMEEQPVRMGKMMSCCAPPSEGGHGRNLCAVECFEKWVTQDPHCPSCRKSWVEEVPRGKWIEKQARVRRAFEQEEEFLEARIRAAERIITVRTTTLEMDSRPSEPGQDCRVRSLTVEERDIAVCHTMYYDDNGEAHTEVEEVDIRRERESIKRRRARAEAAVKRDERIERSMQERMQWGGASTHVQHPLQVAARKYKAARATFLECATADALKHLVATRNMLMTLRGAREGGSSSLESVEDYPLPPDGPLDFNTYLSQYCKNVDFE